MSEPAAPTHHAHGVALRAAVSLLVGGLVLLQPEAGPTATVLAVGVVPAWVLATSLLLLRTGRRFQPPALLGDLALLYVAGTWATGLSRSDLPLLGLLALVLLAPIVSRRWLAGGVLLYACGIVVPVALHAAARDDGSPNHALVLAGGLVLAGCAATLTHRIEAARRRHVDALLAERNELLADAADHVERERRAISQELHDDVLQPLLVVGQDLEDAHGASVDPARELLRASVQRLRIAMAELHPHALSGDALPAALSALVGYHRQAGASVETDIDPDASGPHDAALLPLAREVLATVLLRSSAARVAVRLDCEGDLITLHVRASGVPGPGVPGEDARVQVGVVGVALAAFRLQAVNGGLEITTPAPGEVHHRAWVPRTAPVAGAVDAAEA